MNYGKDTAPPQEGVQPNLLRRSAMSAFGASPTQTSYIVAAPWRIYTQVRN
jgi:hypothetical protein